MDDHSYWPKDEDKKKQSQIENQWQDISERMETEMETFSKEASESSGGLIDQVKVENRERMDCTFIMIRSIWGDCSGKTALW